MKESSPKTVFQSRKVITELHSSTTKYAGCNAERNALLVEHNVEQGFMHGDATVVIDETKFSEAVHEEAHA